MDKDNSIRESIDLNSKGTYKKAYRAKEKGGAHG